MHHKKELWSVFLLATICLGILATQSSGPATAETNNPQSVGLPSGTIRNPQFQDPYHHLSGVVAIPPSRMTGGSATTANPGQWTKLLSSLTPPIFGPNVDSTLNNAANQNETTIAINPDNNQVIIGSANDYRANLQPWIYRTTDGGTTWVNYQVPGTQAILYGDPAVAFDHNNRAYFSYLGYGGSICSGIGGMFTSHSTDAGSSFSPPVQLASNFVGGPIAILQDKEYVAVDSNPASPYVGNVYVAWTEYTFQSGANCGSASAQLSAPIVISRSTDQGITWTQPITASQVLSNNNSSTTPVIGRHGEVYLYYLGAATQQQTNYNSILFSRSTDGGQTFPFFTHIASLTDLPSPLPPTSFRNNAGGSMAADQQLDNYLYAVWSDYAHGDADILLSRSTDNGTTWGTTIRLNDDPVANGKDQFFPWIASSPDGYIHVGWFDRREDATNHNYKEYYTYSSDHGATWAANVAVSTAASVPGSSVFIGDYSGIAASTGVVMPMWTDIRAGTNQNGYVARGVYTPESQATNTPAITNTPAATNTPPTTPSNTPSATNTPASTNTPTNTATNTPTTAPTNTPSPSPTACTISFSDVPPGSTFYDNIRCLACRGIINGYPDGTFRPNNNVTRGQLSKIVSNAAGFNDPQTTQLFDDVPPASTFFDYIGRLASRGYIGGYPCGGPGEPCHAGNLPYFRPNNNATRGQITKIDANSAGFSDTPTGQQFEDVAIGSTYYTYTYRLVSRSIMSGYPCGGVGEPCQPGNLPYFRPNNNATRGQTSKIVGNTFYPDCQTPSRP